MKYKSLSFVAALLVVACLPLSEPVVNRRDLARQPIVVPSDHGAAAFEAELLRVELSPAPSADRRPVDVLLLRDISTGASWHREWPALTEFAGADTALRDLRNGAHLYELDNRVYAFSLYTDLVIEQSDGHSFRSMGDAEVSVLRWLTRHPEIADPHTLHPSGRAVRLDKLSSGAPFFGGDPSTAQYVPTVLRRVSRKDSRWIVTLESPKHTFAHVSIDDRNQVVDVRFSSDADE